MKKYLIYLFIFSFSVGCYYDVEEELYPTLECQTEEVTYSNEVVSIIEKACFKCHDAANNFANITLEGYDNLKKYVDNGQLLGAIRHDVGFSPMPKNEAQLLECDIEKIEAWIAKGALNN